MRNADWGIRISDCRGPPASPCGQPLAGCLAPLGCGLGSREWGVVTGTLGVKVSDGDEDEDEDEDEEEEEEEGGEI